MPIHTYYREVTAVRTLYMPGCSYDIEIISKSNQRKYSKRICYSDHPYLEFVEPNLGYFEKCPIPKSHDGQSLDMIITHTEMDKAISVSITVFCNFI